MRNTRTALITGASGGLGRALSHEFAAAGYRLILSGRNTTRLRAQSEQISRVYGVSVSYFAGDLSVRGAARELCARLEARGEIIDVLVNNAGFGLSGKFYENNPSIQQELLQVNINTVTELCRHFLPRMLERGDGKILNIASLGSLVPGPNNAIYCASKAYVLSMSEALSNEVRGSGVTVTSVCPGAMHTGFARHAGMETTLLFNFAVIDPEHVARIAFDAMMEGRPVVIAGLPTKLMIAALKILPRKAAVALSGLMQRPMTLSPIKKRSAPGIRQIEQ